MSELSFAAELARFGPELNPPPMSSGDAAAYCRRYAHAHYENFTVASWLLPKHLLPHFYSIYAWCRWADDLADETGDPRRGLELLDWWEIELDRCYRGQASHPVLIALRPTIAEFSIPREPFLDLLWAFRQDQRVTRYATFDELLGYCCGSADPVGRLVLYLGRCHTPENVALSNKICTGLQLANFWQDVARDSARGRIYLPRETTDAAGYTAEMFERREYNPAFRAALAAEVARAEDFLRSGWPLVERMPRELKLDVDLFVRGGLSVLAAIRRIEYNVWSVRPTVSRAAKLRLLATSWLGAGRGARVGAQT